jgi:flagellum-specific ATP synthase
MNQRLDVPGLLRRLDGYHPFRTAGKVRASRGFVLSCQLPAAVGDQCEVVVAERTGLLGEVIGFSDDLASVVLYEPGAEVYPGMPVLNRGHGLKLPFGPSLLGRVLDGLGRPVDEAGPLRGCERRTHRTDTPAPLRRARIRRPFVTGQRAIDGLLTCGRGQRVGIFAGSGVGKSTLLGEIAKGADADVNVIALIGERGREVQPFIEDCLGQRGMSRSIVVVATCDQAALLRIRAAEFALAIADDFREQGRHVLLMVDSMTRLAMAQRELGLALGEPPSARSYTPSVFQLLANFVERMGNAERGSITGLLTVLVEGGDLDEPIADALRSFVDGHIVLDRRLAEAGHYPAINIGQSISRVTSEVTEPAHQEAARKLRALLATYAEAEDLLRIGAYVKGTVPALDRAVELRPRVLDFLRQRVDARTPLEETRTRLEQLAAAWAF